MVKKFIIGACAAVLLLFLFNYAYYHLGIYIDLHPDAPVTTFMKTDEDTIYMEKIVNIFLLKSEASIWEWEFPENGQRTMRSIKRRI